MPPAPRSEADAVSPQAAPAPGLAQTIADQLQALIHAGEVLPGERKFTDYAFPPGYSAIDTVLGPGHGYARQPLNGFFDVPNNPRY